MTVQTLKETYILSTQLMELGIPVVMAVNMMDVREERTAIKSHIQELIATSLGCEVVEISALKGTGIKEAADKA